MNQFQEIFDKQKAYFDSDATKSYEWRIDQLTRLENLCNENAEALEAAMSSDFKTASQEKVFEIMAPVGTVRCHLGNGSVQWAIDPAFRPGVPSSCGGQSVHSQTLRGFARHQQGLTGSHSEIF